MGIIADNCEGGGSTSGRTLIFDFLNVQMYADVLSVLLLSGRTCSLSPDLIQQTPDLGAA